MLGLRNHLMIALPAMEDDNFSRSVVYLCDMDPQGALGLIINRPLSMTLGDLFQQLDIIVEDSQIEHCPVMFGGPVHSDRGFVLHEDDGQSWDSSMQVSDTLKLTSSMDILKSIASGKGPRYFLVALGCAGWTIAQLTDELKTDDWLTVESHDPILFDVPVEKRRKEAVAHLGIDLELMGALGHG